MGQFLLLTIGALVVGAIGFGIAVLISGADPGLVPAEAEGRSVGLPTDRPLVESDLARIRFDTATRGYRMAQVDAALRRAAYDIGYKLELIDVLGAEVEALREGRLADADKLRAAREAASSAIPSGRPDSTETSEKMAAQPSATAQPTTGDRADADSVPVEADSIADGDDPSHQPQEMRLS
ncbi:MAG TPA: DivIVA domain-containing protein [Planosporangium sp.]|jgi:DivIVA domain-containing protein|nr:DivIVA domain-containing protein [Planosporangium sp.]